MPILKMKTQIISRKETSGSALVLVMIMSAIALAILASIMTWSASSARLTNRSIQYTRSVSAAEAATEKVITQINHDFLYGGERLVTDNLNTYRQNTVPTAADSAYWNTWQFNDASGNIGQTFVQRTPGNSYTVLGGSYAKLKGYISTYTVTSHATDTAANQDVMGGVSQELQLAGIPIFQFAMYSAGNMEISCGQNFDITGPVHSNKELYVEPDANLTFESLVHAVIGIHDKQRDPLDPRGSPSRGFVFYVDEADKMAPFAPLNLPIGTTSTPEMIREIIEPPPLGEDPNSPLGRLRYYNEVDMILTVSDNGVIGTSGRFNGFSTVITNAELALFVNTNNTFIDNREGKTVLPVDLDIGQLNTWSQTNNNLRLALGGAKLSSLYVVDNRTIPSSGLAAVRVTNGKFLPSSGLTVATGRPLYVQGDYNAPDANLGTSNTVGTMPASLVADAITILSDAWKDGTTGPGIGPPGAAPTTVNAALLTGVVETTSAHYSGGMENFPRFLETWGAANIFTYNGSMVKMFPSLYATGPWGLDNVYDPPKRNWAYDLNFDDPTKLPPKTPSLLTVIRHRWLTVPPGTNSVAESP